MSKKINKNVPHKILEKQEELQNEVVLSEKLVTEWENSGILEGLHAGVGKDVEKLLESNSSQIINEVDETEVEEHAPLFMTEPMFTKAGVPFDESLKEVNFEFKNNYFLGTPSKTAEIQTVVDKLPKAERTLSIIELRHFQRTGIMPK